MNDTTELNLFKWYKFYFSVLPANAIKLKKRPIDTIFSINNLFSQRFYSWVSRRRFRMTDHRLISALSE